MQMALHNKRNCFAFPANKWFRIRHRHAHHIFGFCCVLLGLSDAYNDVQSHLTTRFNIHRVFLRFLIVFFSFHSPFGNTPLQPQISLNSTPHSRSNLEL